MSTKITYNGKTTELADGYIATLPCKDFEMETDVVVEAPEGSGGSSGGGAELNIAYGDTAPEDTSKLWVKTSKPSKVKVAGRLTYENEELTKLSVTADVSKSKAVASQPINNKIYLVGGSNDKLIRYFDITTQSFGTMSAQTPFQNSDDSAIMTVDSKFYIFGGYAYVDGGWNKMRGIHCVDTETDTLTTLGVTLNNIQNGRSAPRLKG